MDGQCTVEINGKAVGLKFNRYAIEQGNAVKGGTSLYKNIIGQIWGGIQGFAFAKQVDSPVDFEEVVDWVDSLDLSGDPDKEFEKITEAFQSSFIYKNLLPKVEENQEIKELDEEKKSNNLTTSGSYLQAS